MPPVRLDASNRHSIHQNCEIAADAQSTERSAYVLRIVALQASRSQKLDVFEVLPCVIFMSDIDTLHCQASNVFDVLAGWSMS